MAVHRVARGFDSTADAYERGRPDYPRQAVGAQSIRDRVGSISFVGVLPDPEREAVLDEVAALVAAQAPPVSIPYETRVYWCPARP